MDFDVQGALDAGYTQAEIDNHLRINNIIPSEEVSPETSQASVEPVTVPTGIPPAEEASVNLADSKDTSDKQDSELVDLWAKGRGRTAGSELKDLWDTRYENVEGTLDQRAQALKEQFAKEQRDQIMDLSDLYKNRHQKYSTTGKSVLGSLGGLSSKIAGALNTPELKVEARRDVIELNKHIANKLVEEGFDAFVSPDNGQLMYKDANGVEQEIDSSILNDLWNSKFENVGSIAGAITGGAMANTASATVLPVTVPTALAKVAIVGSGAIAGGFVGAASGRTLDLLNNSLQLKEDLEAGLVMNQAIEAGFYDTVTSVIGGASLKTVGKVGKAGWKGVGKAYSLVADGNSKGALAYLKDTFHLSDDAAKEITQKFIDTLSEEPKIPRKSLGKVVGGRFRSLSDAEKQILAITSTEQGGERMVATVSKDNMKVANAMAKTVDDRAKGFHKLVASQTDKNVGARVTEDFKLYETEVKDFYAQVKRIGSDAIDGTDYRFDIKDISMDGVIEGLKSNNKSNPDALVALDNFVDSIASRSTDRTFSGLIDLRQSVNDFKYSKLVSKTNKVKGKKTEFDAVNDIINSIDNQIHKAVKEKMPKDVAKEWLGQWKKSKEAYTKMSRLKKNDIINHLSSKTATEKSIQQKLNRYGNDLDVDAKVFNEVMEVLKPATKVKVESAAIKNLTNKYTAGVESGYQALNFPALADELKGLNITTKEGKHIVKTIDKLSKVYKNDPQLSRVSGGVALKQSGDSSIATTIEGKARAKLIHDVWNVINKFNPTKSILNENALINKLDVLLADPLKQKGVDDFLKTMPESQREVTRSLVKELQIAMTKAGTKAESKMSKGDKAFKKMYKQSKTGKLVKSNGALGRGIYLVDRVKNPSAASRVISHEVNLSKMIDVNSVGAALGRDITIKEIRDNVLIQQELKDKGFEGLLSGNKAMLFEGK